MAEEEMAEEEMAEEEAEPAMQEGEGTLGEVLARGALQCGVNTDLFGFGYLDDTGRNVGFDVEFCRAIAAAVLGDGEAVEFTSLNADQRFPAIQTGEVDVLIRNTTWTLTRDTDLGLVRLRAFGTFSMQVSDPALFVNKIVGAQGMYETQQITRFLRGIIVAKLTDLLGELGKGLFDLPALYDEIGAGSKAKVQDDFANVGIQLRTLYVNSISPTEETARAIDERASMGAIGDMQKYMQYQTALGIRDAAQAGGEGGGVSP